MLLSIGVLQAQLKTLSVKLNTQAGIGVYPCGDNRHEAMVQFVTKEPFELAFKSNLDAELNLTCDSLAGTKTYSIVFITQAPGEDFSYRRLTIMTPGFEDYLLMLPLKDKQKFVYDVSDPYSQLRNPFYVNMERAQEVYQRGNYHYAKDIFQLCKTCPEYEDNAEMVEEHIARCDSMMKWYDEALTHGHFARYRAEAECWGKMMQYSDDAQLRTNLFAAQTNFTNDCEALYRMAGNALNDNNLEKAKVYYQEIIDNGCSYYLSEATDALAQIRKTEVRKNDHSRTLMVVASGNMYGLSWGNYYVSRPAGWYGTFMFNKQDIDLLTGKTYVKGGFKNSFDNYSYGVNVLTLQEVESHEFRRENMEADADKNLGRYVPKDGKLDFEAMLAFGGSWHVWEPIFVHCGIGYHGGGFCDFSESLFLDACQSAAKDQSFSLNNSKTWGSDFKHDYTKHYWFHGVAPEVGIVLKYWRLAVKFSYQYTMWFDDRNYEEFLDDNYNRFQFGVGFCW